MALQDEPLFRNTIAAMHARLDAHFSWLLDCDAAALRCSTHCIVATTRRHEPLRGGLLVPVLGVKPLGSSGCVLSCVPELASGLRQCITPLDGQALPFDPAWRQAVWALSLGTERLQWAVSHVYVTDSVHFRPHGVDPSVRVERLVPGTNDARHCDPAFDEPQFVVRDAHGAVAAWAGIRRSSEIAWEVAAATQPEYRGRGLATVLTALATAHVLAEGKLALWLAPEENIPSQRLVQRLGFQDYGELLMAYMAESDAPGSVPDAGTRSGPNGSSQIGPSDSKST